jgi:hypothetical protein
VLSAVFPPTSANFYTLGGRSYAFCGFFFTLNNIYILGRKVDCECKITHLMMAINDQNML